MNKTSFEAFANEMKEAIKSPEDRHAVAEKIVKYISDSIDQRDLASLVLPKESIPVGTTAEYAVPGKLKAYWHEPGSYAPRTAMTQKVFTVPTYMISAHPEYEISQLEAGRYGTVQDQVKAAREAIQGAINARMFNTVNGSITSSDANYATSASELSMSALNEAIDYVEDQIGGAKAIVGRRSILSAIKEFGHGGTSGTSDSGVFGDATKESVLKGNKILSYRGVPIVALPQWRDGFGRVTIPQDTVIVVGEDVGRYVVNQELDSKDEINVDDLMWHIHLYMKVGFAVFFPERMYKIVIT